MTNPFGQFWRWFTGLFRSKPKPTAVPAVYSVTPTVARSHQTQAQTSLVHESHAQKRSLERDEFLSPVAVQTPVAVIPPSFPESALEAENPTDPIPQTEPEASAADFIAPADELNSSQTFDPAVANSALSDGIYDSALLYSYVDPMVSLNKAEADLHAIVAGEFLGHYLAYEALVDGAVVGVISPQLDAAGQPFYAKHHVKKIHTHDAGIVGYILTPLEIQANETADLKVIFRGTADGASTIRDTIEGANPGAVSLKAEMPSILGQIAAEIQNLPAENKVSVTFAGHSLGGADAASTAAATLNAIAENHGWQGAKTGLDDAALIQFDRVENITVHLQNAAGISHESKALADDCVRHLETQGRPVSVDCHTLFVAGDPVQASGETHLFCDSESKNVKHKMLYVHTGHNETNAIKHGALAGVATACVFLPLAPVAACLTSLLSFARQAMATHCAVTSEENILPKFEPASWTAALKKIIDQLGNTYRIVCLKDNRQDMNRILGTKSDVVKQTLGMFFTRTSPASTPRAVSPSLEENQPTPFQGNTSPAFELTH